MSTAQASSLGGPVKIISFTMTNTAKTVLGWLSDSTALDLNTGALPAFSLDNIVAVLFTGYTGTLNYGGTNTQPIAWPANADFTTPAIGAPSGVSVKTSAATFTVYAVVVFGSST